MKGLKIALLIIFLLASTSIAIALSVGGSEPIEPTPSVTDEPIIEPTPVPPITDEPTEEPEDDEFKVDLSEDKIIF